ncbi:MAG: hypothetical protein DRP81_07595 [Candidatus Omnitrophota bacterium]|nr:MAG: hypothetical protein DRP81_07595 [Candidatus Omnitrophota bacterium]
MKIFTILLFTFLLFVNAPYPIFSQHEEVPLNQQKKLSSQEVKEEEAEKESQQENKEPIKEKTQQPPQPKSILEIKGIEEQEGLYSLELKDVELADFFRVVAHNYHLNILVDEEVKGKITASLTNVTLEEALERIVEANHLTLEKKGNIIIIKPNLITKIFILKHIEAKRVLEGESDEKESKSAAIHTLLSDQGKIFLGKQSNSLIVTDHPANVEKIMVYLKSIDKGMSSRVFKLKYISAKDIVEEKEDEKKKESSK